LRVRNEDESRRQRNKEDINFHWRKLDNPEKSEKFKGERTKFVR
jgi:hypothetical protein